MKKNIVAPKILCLKEGAPVILTRNIGHGLYNGMCGTVKELKRNCAPVIHFGGRLITIPKVDFEILHPENHTPIATRKQYPVLLAYALTVHRAQGQTLPYVYIDCYSFFSAGQLGVAVGRCTTLSGLRITNFNRQAACIKHPDCVYEFYRYTGLDPDETLSCCNNITEMTAVSNINMMDDLEDLFLDFEFDYEHMKEVERMEDEHIVRNAEVSINDDNQEPFEIIECPLNMSEFYDENKDNYFLSVVQKDDLDLPSFHDYCNRLYTKMMKLLSIEKRKNHSAWVSMYSQINQYLLSDDHLNMCKAYFGVISLTKEQNKFGTKLMLFMLDKEIEKKAESVKKDIKTTLKTNTVINEDVTPVAKAKVRYIAGAVVHKISKKLKDSVLRDLSKVDKKNKSLKKLNYKKQVLLKQFRIMEEDVNKSDGSYMEIESKQGQSRGLFIVSGEMLDFFMKLNAETQHILASDSFHFYGSNIHIESKNYILGNEKLIGQWLKLFESIEVNDIEDEMFMILLLDLYSDVCKYFLKISLADALKTFKESVPRKKNRHCVLSCRQ